ncbi:hypothetical protein B7988_14205 [Fibrobacter sp. UWB1]|jgi:hypothetical protein|uniref:hypothetical protein n=1 Tax=Fibrobacter TaxID=832 RepID=UPI000920C264|nr:MULTISPECIES: hypothetical protein [Fibrobacter]MBR4681563.1 hypothetical protein [Fibrobacter sp.]OWV24122.1 hypothetical protein B7988_14205 [Fibrobacter sp. UWB1]SHL76298.1 hypothetical protein SAMN05720470_11510 [Fibrobacter sp. UWOV1]
MNLKALVAAGALLATQSFAIVGVGFHYAPGFGTKMKSAEPAPIANNINLSHDGFDGMMQGFGFKAWIDLLPVIDIEATLNIQFGSYDASLWVDNPADGTVNEIPLEIELGGTPFGKANPKFVAMTGDLSITYPITTLPIIRPYIGGGLSYHLNSFVLNQKFASSFIQPSTFDEVAAIVLDQTMDNDAKSQALQAKGQEMKAQIQDKALDEGLNTSIGGHILVGLRAKLPIIPIAAYGNFKYYIGGDYPSEVDPGNMTVELGVGLAI